MSWLIFTILAIISRATYSLATKLLSKHIKVSAITQSLLLTFSSGVLAILAIPLLGNLDYKNISAYILPITLLIVSAAFGNIIYFRGQKTLDAGSTQIAFSSILIWGAILSVLFLGTNFKFIQLIGIIILMGAILLVQNIKSSVRLNAGIIYIVISAVLFAIFQVASAGISKTFNTSSYLILSFFGQSLIIGSIYFKTIKKDLYLLKNQLRNTSTKSLFASGTSLLYNIFAYLAYKNAPDRGIVVVLLISQVVLSVIFGILFLKERENLHKKLFAGVLAFIAGVLIKS